MKYYFRTSLNETNAKIITNSLDTYDKVARLFWLRRDRCQMNHIQEVELFPHLNHEVVENITGFKLCSYLVALEGWRRGLDLRWYHDETDLCKMDRLNSSTQGKFFSLTSKEKTHYFFRSRGDKVVNKAVRVCQNKEKTKEYLRESGVPITEGATFSEDSKIVEYAEKMGFPVVVKPLNGSMGKGVYTNIMSVDELKEVLRELRSTLRNKELMIEKYYPGKEYRVYVVGDRVIGATNRIPANVVGDGKHTIDELIQLKNEERKKNPYLAPKPIKVDFEVRSLLEKGGYSLESIPAEGEKFFLREKSNLSSGGDPIEATHELTEEVQQIAVDALKALPSIPHAGVDVIVDPDDPTKGVILEVNATAEIGFHLYPLEGKPRDIPAAIIDYYFPETTNNTRSYAYFDYLSVLEPLKTWATEEVKVFSISSEQYFVKKYTISGKVTKVGYMNFIKRQAMKQGLFGKARKLGKDIEVVIISTDQAKLDKFSEICKKGSKRSKVEKVIETDAEVLTTPFKLGFEILI